MTLAYRIFIIHHQALQWFDPQGHLIEQKGKDFLSLPLPQSKEIQFQTLINNRIQAVTLPIVNSNNKKVIGYVRASQSLKEFDETSERLDWGLCGGIFVALVISSVGGVWLTRQAMQPIEESFERLKQFTADASHELRSPLMVIESNAAVALKYQEGMRVQDVEKFDAITSATNQMTRLTEDLLFLARNDNVSNKDWDTVNLTVILDKLIKLSKSQAEAKKIDLKAQLTENLYLLGDAVQITRLFRNLIDNALHYTPSEGTVEIKIDRVGSLLIVDVQDTGIGIAIENLQKVFERFWRGDTSRSDNGGSGLGLAIAQAIAQTHGGFITVTSHVGVGSRFNGTFTGNHISDCICLKNSALAPHTA